MRASIFLPLVAAFASTASAQTIFSDDFSSQPANPNDLGWYSSTTSVTTFSAASGGLQFNPAGTSNSSVFKQFAERTLAVGETITVSFAYTAFANLQATAANSFFRIGLFDTNNTFTSNQTASPWTNAAKGYVMGIGLNATATSGFFYRSAPSSGGIVTTGGTPAATALGNETFQIATTPLPATVQFSLTRTDVSTLSVAGSFTQNNVTTSYTTRTVTGASFSGVFDTIFLGIGTPQPTTSFTIDDVSVSVIPEPASFAALAGFAVLVFFGLRRRARA